MRWLSFFLVLAILVYDTPIFAGPRSVTVESLERDTLRSPWPPASFDLLVAQTAAPSDDPRASIDARIADLQREQDEISTRGPRGAAIAGGVMLGFGALLAGAAALACASADSGDDTECREDRATGIEIGGGVLAGIGLITLVSGLSTLSARKRRVNDLGERIEDLKEERSSLDRLEARVRFGEVSGLTISWRY